MDAEAGELLDLAYESVCKFPLDPHLKNRSRAQDAVVQAALEVGELERAKGYVPRIENWLRGLGYARLGYAQAIRGQREAALESLALAEEFLGFKSDPSVEQKWRIDRVRAWIASAHLALGNESEWVEYSSNLESSEARRASQEEARFLEDAEVDSYLEAYSGVLERGENEPVLAVLESSVELLKRFGGDPQRRDAILALLGRGEKRTARQPYVTLIVDVADVLSGFGESELAGTYLDKAARYVEDATWLPADEAELRSLMAKGLARAGRNEAAIKQAEAGSSVFDAGEEGVPDMFRDEPLRALAEAFLAAGAEERAAELYARAVEAGALNPNSRPRAEDLAKTLCSMVLNGFEPEASLRARMAEISAGLGNPW